MQYIWKEGMYELYIKRSDTDPDEINYVGGSPVIIEGTISGWGQTQEGPPYDWSFEPLIRVNGASKDDVFVNLKLLLGVAYHSRKVDSFIKKVTVIRAPAVITIFKGTAKMKEFQQAEEFFPFGFTEDDPYPPFDPNPTKPYEQGDLLIPIKKVVTGVGTFSVWTNDLSLLPQPGTGQTLTYVLPAKVLSVVGTGESAILTIELGAFYHKISA
jgi:hypothetical protein